MKAQNPLLSCLLRTVYGVNTIISLTMLRVTSALREPLVLGISQRTPHCVLTCVELYYGQLQCGELGLSRLNVRSGILKHEGAS